MDLSTDEILLNNLKIGTILLNNELKIIQLNHQVKDWFPNLNLNDSICNLKELCNFEKQKTHDCFTSQVFETGIDKEFQIKVFINNELKTFLIKIQAVKTDQNKIDFISLILEDKTSEIKKNQELEELSQEGLRLKRVLEHSPSSIVITDIKGNIEYVNPKFTETTGYSLKEAIGKNPRILKGEETSSREYTLLWETILAGYEWSGEFHNVKKNGEYFWEKASISPVMDSDGKIINFIAIKEDITKMKLLEDRLKLVHSSLDSHVNPICIASLVNGKILYSNMAFLQKWKLIKQEDILFPDLFQEDQEVLTDAIQASITDGWSGNLIAKSSKGDSFAIKVVFSPVMGELHDSICVLAVFSF